MKNIIYELFWYMLDIKIKINLHSLSLLLTRGKRRIESMLQHMLLFLAHTSSVGLSPYQVQKICNVFVGIRVLLKETRITLA